MRLLQPLNLQECYEYKIQELTESDSKMGRDKFQKHKGSVLRLMKENRPLYEKLVTLFHFLEHALGQIDYTMFETIRDAPDFDHAMETHLIDNKFKSGIIARVEEFVKIDKVVSRERMDQMIEFVSIFPLAIKNSLNVAPGLDQVWKDMRRHKKETENDNTINLAKERARLNPSAPPHLTGLISFILSKFEVRNGGNTRQSFRFLDK